MQADNTGSGYAYGICGFVLVDPKIVIIVAQMPMFTVLSSWLDHCQMWRKVTFMELQTDMNKHFQYKMTWWHAVSVQQRPPTELLDSWSEWKRLKWVESDEVISDHTRDSHSVDGRRSEASRRHFDQLINQPLVLHDLVRLDSIIMNIRFDVIDYRFLQKSEFRSSWRIKHEFCLCKFV